MEIIRHRVNSVRELRELDLAHGAECDVRSRGSRLILNHEAFQDGDALADYLDCYAEQKRAGTLILNPKEDGFEGELLSLVRARSIRNFFFLDLTMPTTVRLVVRQGVRNIALRASEFEPPEALSAFRGKAGWAWLDCFTGEPPKVAVAASLKRYFRVCVVSPELQGYSKDKIARFKPLAARVDAVCTKFPELWS